MQFHHHDNRISVYMYHSKLVVHIFKPWSNLMAVQIMNFILTQTVRVIFYIFIAWFDCIIHSYVNVMTVWVCTVLCSGQ